MEVESDHMYSASQEHPASLSRRLQQYTDEQCLSFDDDTTKPGMYTQQSDGTSQQQPESYQDTVPIEELHKMNDKMNNLLRRVSAQERLQQQQSQTLAEIKSGLRKQSQHLEGEIKAVGRTTEEMKAILSEEAEIRSQKPRSKNWLPWFGSVGGSGVQDTVTAEECKRVKLELAQKNKQLADTQQNLKQSLDELGRLSQKFTDYKQATNEKLRLSREKIASLQKELQKKNTEAVFGQRQCTGQSLSAGDKNQSTLRKEYEILFTNVANSAAVDMMTLHYDEQTAKNILCSTFQIAYDAARDLMTQKMCDELCYASFTPHTNPGEDISRKTAALGQLVHIFQMKTLSYEDDLTHTVVHKLSEHVMHLYNRKKSIQKFIRNAVHLSWDMVTMQPPMIIDVSKKEYDKGAHDKDPECWSDECREPLYYFRPTLYYSYEGEVAHKGWVGNNPSKISPHK